MKYSSGLLRVQFDNVKTYFDKFEQSANSLLLTTEALMRWLSVSRLCRFCGFHAFLSTEISSSQQRWAYLMFFFNKIRWNRYSASVCALRKLLERIPLKNNPRNDSRNENLCEEWSGLPFRYRQFRALKHEVGGNGVHVIRNFYTGLRNCFLAAQRTV